MTRACLFWAVFMAALGSALAVTDRAHAQICTDYYRFGPLYSNSSPFVDGCMEAYAEDPPVETQAASDVVFETADLRGRAVVAVLDDPVEPAPEAAMTGADSASDSADVSESCAAAEPMMCPTTTQTSGSATHSHRPHYRAYEDYYGYEYYRHGCPSSMTATAPTTTTASEPAPHVSQDSPNAYYSKYAYLTASDSHESASTEPPLPAHEQTEAQTAAESFQCYEPACHRNYEFDAMIQWPAQTGPAADETHETNEAVCQPEAYDSTCHHSLSVSDAAEGDESAATDSLVESYDAYHEYDYRYERSGYELYQSYAEAAEASAAAAEVADTQVNDSPSRDVELYDAYGCGYDHGLYVESSNDQPVESEADQQVAADANREVASSETSTTDSTPHAEAYQGYDAYRYGYYRGYYYGAMPSHGETSESMVSEATVNAEPALEQAENAIVEPAAEDDQYRAFDYGYQYGCHEAAPNADPVSAPESPAVPQVEGSAKETVADYDMYEGYEYDQYQPYDEIPQDMEQNQVDHAAADDPYDSYDVYDYDNVPTQIEKSPACDADTSTATESPVEPAETSANDPVEIESTQSDAADLDYGYYGRYPYGYGRYYDYEYQKHHGASSESVDVTTPAEAGSEPNATDADDASADATLDLQPLAGWVGHLQLLSGAKLVETLSSAALQLQDVVGPMVQRVDLQQLQNKVGQAMLAMVQQNAAMASPQTQANVFLYEFDAGFDVGFDMPIWMRNLPWLAQDSVADDDSHNVQDSVAVEPARDSLVSVLSTIDRDVLIHWAKRTWQEAQELWATLSPELERMAAETLARVSQPEAPSTDQR